MSGSKIHQVLDSLQCEEMINTLSVEQVEDFVRDFHKFCERVNAETGGAFDVSGYKDGGAGRHGIRIGEMTTYVELNDSMQMFIDRGHARDVIGGDYGIEILTLSSRNKDEEIASVDGFPEVDGVEPQLMDGCIVYEFFDERGCLLN